MATAEQTSFVQGAVTTNAIIMAVVAALALYQVVFWNKQNKKMTKDTNIMKYEMGRSGVYFTIAMSLFAAIIALFPMFSKLFGGAENKLVQFVTRYLPLKPTSLIGVMALLLGGAFWYSYRKSFEPVTGADATEEASLSPMLARLQWPAVLFLMVIGTMAIANYLQKVIKNFMGDSENNKYMGLRNFVSLITTLSPIIMMAVAQYFTDLTTQQVARENAPAVGAVPSEESTMASRASYVAKGLLVILVAIVVLQVVITGLATFQYDLGMLALFSGIGK